MLADLPDIALDQLGLLFKAAIHDLTLPTQVLVNLLCLLESYFLGLLVADLFAGFFVNVFELLRETFGTFVNCGLGLVDSWPNCNLQRSVIVEIPWTHPNLFNSAKSNAVREDVVTI